MYAYVQSQEEKNSRTPSIVMGRLDKKEREKGGKKIGVLVSNFHVLSH